MNPIRRLYRVASRTLSVDPMRLARSLAALPGFLRDAIGYSRRARDSTFPLRWSALYPALADRNDAAGGARGHYFWQDLWAARKIFERRPGLHVDIGSRLDGFVAHLLTFMPVTVVDIRPLRSSVPGLTFVQGDATDLATFAPGSVISLSTLHAVEHFGLGRYGDPIDPGACFRAMSSLARVLAPGGFLYFSVPVGKERVEFNAHRVFAPRTVLDAFGELRLVSLAGVDDSGEFLETAAPEQLAEMRYGCGLFEFTR